VSYKSFHLIWCWVWLVSLWECLVSHLSGCEVTIVRIDAVVWARFGMVDTVWFHQVMWIGMLESTKDRMMGVDTLGQHVPPRVWYGRTSWLIRKALVSLSYWMSGTGMAIPTRPQGARGAWGYSVVPNRGKPLQLWKGPEGILLYPTRGNLWQSKTCDLGLTFVKACSDLLASHHWSVIMLGWHGNMEVL
jgi:hypothetical protein